MLSLVKKISIVATSVFLFAATAMPANNAEQVVFSTPGFTMNLSGNTKATSTPFGFWIWCAAAAAPGSNGGYQNANACQGSMYFYALDTHATPVIGFVTEGPDGIYTMTIFQGTFAQLLKNTLHPAYTCQLANTTSAHEVEVACNFSSTLGGGTGGPADVTNAVVNVTGP